jgi:hypothetical protein
MAQCNAQYDSLSCSATLESPPVWCTRPSSERAESLAMREDGMMHADDMLPTSPAALG